MRLLLLYRLISVFVDNTVARCAASGPGAAAVRAQAYPCAVRRSLHTARSCCATLVAQLQAVFSPPNACRQPAAGRAGMPAGRCMMSADTYKNAIDIFHLT